MRGKTFRGKIRVYLPALRCLQLRFLRQSRFKKWNLITSELNGFVCKSSRTSLLNYTWGDMYAYLIVKEGCGHESLKAYKSLEAFRLGWTRAESSK